MIVVKLQQGKLTIRGHAGYAARGKDIVCAAASALAEVLRQRFGGRTAPGRAEFLLPEQDATLLSVLGAFLELQRVYPGYVRVQLPG